MKAELNDVLRVICCYVGDGERPAAAGGRGGRGDRVAEGSRKGRGDQAAVREAGEVEETGRSAARLQLIGPAGVSSSSTIVPIVYCLCFLACPCPPESADLLLLKKIVNRRSRPTRSTSDQDGIDGISGQLSVNICAKSTY